MLLWKERRSGKEALLIDGARRVGKSWIVEEFAKNEYDSYILIDFSNTKNSIRQLFIDYEGQMDAFFMHLRLETGVKLFDRKSLIVFDEIQNFPKAREAIKYLVKDGRYDYIETGSLMSINANVKGINIPSEEHRIDMFPMDFEEFIWALGDDMMMDYVRECFANRKPLGQSLHRKMMEYLRLYMIIGGMPQAVKEWVETMDFDEVDRTKRNILSLYRSDISKYASGQEAKVTRIFDTIPSQLQKHEKKFRLSALGTGVRSRSVENAFFWLEESRVVNVCYAATEPTVGLEMRVDESARKIYMADTGLFVSMLDDGTQFDIMQGNLHAYKGAIFENLVADIFTKMKRRLYYFRKDSGLEVDFVTRYKGECVLVEVKAKDGNIKSSKTILSHPEKYHVNHAIKLGDLNVGSSGQFLTLPLYMTFLLRQL